MIDIENAFVYLGEQKLLKEFYLHVPQGETLCVCGGSVLEVERLR